MEIALDKFEVDGLMFEWGKTLHELDSALSHLERFRSSYYQGNFRCSCKNIFGFSAIEFQATAPSVNRPVMRIEYKLAPYNPSREKNRYDFWSTPLRESLGKPDDVFTGENAGGTVSYMATWHKHKMEIRLCVYKQLRKETSGIFAADITIKWEDEITAAKPYLIQNEQLESELFSNPNLISSLTKYKLGRNQDYYNRNSDEENKLPEKDRELFRKSKRALRQQGVIETPWLIKNELTIYECALWRILNTDDWALSTRWDTLIFNNNSKPDITWENTLPAKGSGITYFSFNRFALYDDHSSEEIKKLVRELEKIIGEEIEYLEDYDC